MPKLKFLIGFLSFLLIIGCASVLKKEDILLEAQKIKATLPKQEPQIPVVEHNATALLEPPAASIESSALALAAEKMPEQEKLIFKAKYLGLTIGEFITINNGKTILNGQDVYCFEMISKTMPFFTALFGAKDRYVSYMDAKKFVVLRHEEYVKGGVILESTVDFDYANCKAHYKNHLNGQVKELAIPKRLLDVLSGGFYLRMMPWSLGDTSEFDLYADDTIYNFIGLLSASKQIILADNTVHESYLLKPYVFSNGKQLKKVSAEVFFSASGSKRPLHAILKTPLGNVSVELAQTINLPTKGSL